MPKRRDRIRMTDEEAWAFLETRKSIQTATINKDGSPHLTTNWFGIADGAIVLETYTKSQKIVNLRRDPRIALLVEDGDDYNELRGVSINGVAELFSDPEDVARLASHVVKRNNPDVPEDMLHQAAEQLARKRSAIVVKPQKIMSWDHRKLGGAR